MNVKFDKEEFEKNLKNVKLEQDNTLADTDDKAYAEKLIENTIRNSIQSSKLGALSVDPTYLQFRTLDRKIILSTIFDNKIF